MSYRGRNISGKHNYDIHAAAANARVTIDQVSREGAAAESWRKRLSGPRLHEREAADFRPDYQEC